MQLSRLRLIWTPGARLQVWQKRDGFRSIALGDNVDIDDVTVEDIDSMHGAFAAALNLPCRPRTYDEMLAGHTRAGLALLDESPDPDDITIVLDALDEYGDQPEPVLMARDRLRAGGRGVVLTPEQRAYLADLVDIDGGQNAEDLDARYLSGLLRA